MTASDADAWLSVYCIAVLIIALACWVLYRGRTDPRRNDWKDRP